MGYTFAILALLFPVLILLHLLVAPYTKVEESFHVQAVHDILTNGLPNGFNDLNLARVEYDHFSFPGAVPRSAIGAAALAVLLKPVILLNEEINRQLLARAILGLINASSLAVYARGLRRSFGQPAAIWYILFQASQFHLMFYASRPLSNMFAFGITTLAMCLLLPSPRPTPQDQKQCSLALALLTTAGVVFRSELALLVGTQTLFLLATRKISLSHTVIAGLVGLTTGLTLTVYLDSTFWQSFPLWPEFEAFRFNVLAGQSSEWGTEPWSFYFMNSLPRLLFNPLSYLLAIPVALRQPATRSPALALLTPALSFVALYSFQPHKEWRFIVYIIPSLTAVAALGAAYLWTHRSRSVFATLAARALAVSTLVVFCLSNFVLLPASAANYPGGQALDAMHHQHSILHDTDLFPGKANSSINVYLGNLACQTGVTRFLQQPPSSGWVYDKTEDKAVKSTPGFWDRFDYVVVEASDEIGFMDADQTSLRRALPTSDWERMLVVDSFAGVSVLRPGIPATGSVERRVVGAIAGARAVGLFERLRECVREVLLRGWWVEVKMRPRVQVLRRVREGFKR
ncbi:Alpha-1,6-mannosyltransferase subunit (Ecm39), putative [Penicillium digitatum]|uniref:Mannosyltransferase n=3 Tax=Penicillium digitatum TaxID=36651 RepID=K9FG37_PEND2|nr:Alpha-1,6-mannosyltransferase subunit (Ecm39), putative [Penicillium digitatum Pd1]EKV07142.1 Alpha-1,6-mannosyltransferase subunit (Ecm39), putative [Penicillium digitatum PHI26]EKV14287.1 Alpha-1,6-mannosyltransferase subunit (Ecm39), putative [Penicillium digitatum Pd1]QQK46124.1 Alpha-1,6-mannosyltransferase subunit (Ecm39), putative [Penicillium digitatum]